MGDPDGKPEEARELVIFHIPALLGDGTGAPEEARELVTLFQIPELLGDGTEAPDDGTTVTGTVIFAVAVTVTVKLV